jgi:hypothetical protein
MLARVTIGPLTLGVRVRAGELLQQKKAGVCHGETLPTQLKALHVKTDATTTEGKLLSDALNRTHVSAFSFLIYIIFCLFSCGRYGKRADEAVQQLKQNPQSWLSVALESIHADGTELESIKTEETQQAAKGIDPLDSLCSQLFEPIQEPIVLTRGEKSFTVSSSRELVVMCISPSVDAILRTNPQLLEGNVALLFDQFIEPNPANFLKPRVEIGENVAPWRAFLFKAVQLTEIAAAEKNLRRQQALRGADVAYGLRSGAYVFSVSSHVQACYTRFTAAVDAEESLRELFKSSTAKALAETIFKRL